MRRRKPPVKFPLPLGRESGIHRPIGHRSGEAAESHGKKDKPSAAAGDRATEGGRQYVAHLEKINTVYYDQIKIADQKAAFIFTFMLAFLVSSAEGSSVFKMER